MGLIYADIEIINGEDLVLARRKLFPEESVRRLSVSALVDSGAYMLCINENIQNNLDLPVIDATEAELANGQLVKLNVVGPVEIRFENRSTTCRAAVLPGNAEVLLGSIPREDLDVVLLPREQTIDVNPESPFIAKKKMK